MGNEVSEILKKNENYIIFVAGHLTPSISLKRNCIDSYNMTHVISRKYCTIFFGILSQ